MTAVTAPATPKSRKRILSPIELKALWLATFKLNDPFGPFLRILIGTIQRRSEVAGLPWIELRHNQLVWIMDAARAKNDEDHLVPLSPLVMRELTAFGWRHNGLVFTTTGKTAISGFSRAKEQLDTHMEQILQELEIEAAAGEDREPKTIQLPRWTFHDIRRTGTTVMQGMGVPIEITERCLTHSTGETKDGIRGVYNLWKYEPEKRRAFDLWGAHLEGLISSPLSDFNQQTHAERNKLW